MEFIEINPHIVHGKPVIKGTRIMVENVLDLLVTGYTVEQIIKDFYPNLTKKQVLAAIDYANQVVKNEEVYPKVSA